MLTETKKYLFILFTFDRDSGKVIQLFGFLPDEAVLKLHTKFQFLGNSSFGTEIRSKSVYAFSFASATVYASCNLLTVFPFLHTCELKMSGLLKDP